MKELITIFQKNKKEIGKRLLHEIGVSKIEDIENENLDKAFVYLDSLETIYAVDSDFIQLSPIFRRDSESKKLEHKVKNSLKENIHLGEDNHFISSPYISEKSNKYVVTMIKKIGDRLIAFDFDLYKLLKEERHVSIGTKFFIHSSKIIYGLIGVGLSLFSLILVFYSLYDFLNRFSIESANIFQLIFKSVIGLTLGLAIFDLAKNLLEHEVFFKEEFHKAHGGNQLLVKFLISITIALAIEALMMVFKVALKNEYRDIIYAVSLILAISFMLFAMNKYDKDKNNNSVS